MHKGQQDGRPYGNAIDYLHILYKVRHLVSSKAAIDEFMGTIMLSVT
jgi:hypothetical protein